MKTTKKKKNEEMRAEYDFSKAERGKSHRSLGKGYKVHIHQADGTVVVNHYTLAEGTGFLRLTFVNISKIQNPSMKPCAP